MKTAIEIAQEATMKPITQLAAQLGLEDASVIPYGRYKAKIDHRLIHNAKKDVYKRQAPHSPLPARHRSASAWPAPAPVCGQALPAVLCLSLIHI